MDAVHRFQHILHLLLPLVDALLRRTCALLDALRIVINFTRLVCNQFHFSRQAVQGIGLLNRTVIQLFSVCRRL